MLTWLVVVGPAAVEAWLWTAALVDALLIRSMRVRSEAALTLVSGDTDDKVTGLVIARLEFMAPAGVM